MSESSRRRRQRHAATQRAKEGKSPGTPIYVGEAPATPIAVRLIDYGPDQANEGALATVRECARHRDSPTVSWIDVSGIHDTTAIVEIGKAFDVHPLWIEDVLNVTGRPKSEVLDERVLVVCRMATFVNGEVHVEQVSIVAGPTWVITFQDEPGDVWDGVRERIRSGSGRIRRMGADYLLHALLDAIVDHYYLVLEDLEGLIDAVEDTALDATDGTTPGDVHDLKQQLALFRGVAYPMREALAGLLRAEGSIVRADTAPFFRDIYDHAVQVMDIHDSARERLVGVLELHLAVTSHRLNSVMKVLTVVSTIFIPITFLAGIWGMNFHWMPETEIWWAYPAALGTMGLVALVTGIWTVRGLK
jgi:magnesium transporter